MDIYKLDSELKYVNQIGQTLNVEERLKLELAFLRLQETEKFDQILFWGKIEGVASDYYVALGLNFKGYYEFPLKKFFWSNQTFNFAELPDINEDYKEKVDSFRTPFSGQQEKILVEVENPEEEGEAKQEEENPEQNQQEDLDEDEVEVKKKPKNFTELDRLAYVVRAIDNDCSCVPVGAFKLTPTHEIRYNEAFGGLKIDEAQDLSKYQHFRQPSSEDKKNQMERDDALFSFDFLDPLTEDRPKGCWSIHCDSSKRGITIRSLLWPGFLGYHRVLSDTFGYVYMGNGIKNSDLPFLVQA